MELVWINCENFSNRLTISIEWVAEFRSIAMTQIDLIRHNTVIPECLIDRVNRLRLIGLLWSVSMAIRRSNWNQSNRWLLTNKLNQFYHDDSYDFDASIRLNSTIPKIMMFWFNRAVEIDWLRSINWLGWYGSIGTDCLDMISWLKSICDRTSIRWDGWDQWVANNLLIGMIWIDCDKFDCCVYSVEVYRSLAIGQNDGNY